MTRINGNILPSELSNKHLIAEHREIKRVCYRLNYRLKSGKFNDIPAPFFEIKNGEIVFKELFWLDKGKFTHDRYKTIRDEIIKRKSDGRIKSDKLISDFSSNWEIYKKKPEYYKDYKFPEEYNEMLKKRIKGLL